MNIRTTRFGPVEIKFDDVINFPAGIIGFEDQRHWVILADEDNDCVAWLQSVSRPEIALPVVSPRRFLQGYEVHVAQAQLKSLNLGAIDHAYVLCVLGQEGDLLTLNLRAPLIINLDRRIGRQVITTDEQPVQHQLAPLPLTLRKSA